MKICLFRGYFLQVIFMLMLVSCGGCITASLATIGTAIGALGSAASTGADAYSLGKLNAVLPVSGSDCHRAVLQSCVDLDLSIAIDSLSDPEKLAWEMTLRDALNSPIGIRIEQRSARMCRCRVDVGVFGSSPTAKLFMERIRANLKLPPVKME